MISHSEREHIAPEALRLHRLATQIVEAIPSDIGDRIRCHELARAVCQTLRPIVPNDHRLEVVDGKFGAIIEHSWIEYQPSPPRAGYRIDVYTPGVHPQVLLVCCHFLIDAGVTYVPAQERNDIDTDTVAQIVAVAQPIVNAAHRCPKHPRPQTPPRKSAKSSATGSFDSSPTRT